MSNNHILKTVDINLHLIGEINTQIVGHRLPSIRQVLSTYFYNRYALKFSVNKSSELVIQEDDIFWKKVRMIVINIQKKYYYLSILGQFNYKIHQTVYIATERFMY